jgi:catalase
MSTSAISCAEEIVAPDEAALASEFISFLKAASMRRAQHGPIRRFNQGRAAGCVEAEFTVNDDLPASLRVGVFAQPRPYRAFIRFANASSTTDRERDVRGMAIGLRDVPGENLTPGQQRQDFVLNSHPVMMVPDVRAFLTLFQANEAGGVRRLLYFVSHPRAARIAAASRQHPSSHLDISYWSATPYLFGPRRAVKYKARPCSTYTSALPRQLSDDYLHDALIAHLERADACFDFMIQLQTDGRRMPIEDATIEWKEEQSPFAAVARIHIPRQKIDEPNRTKACDDAAFNPWNCLAEHRPLGSMNRARREIYQALSAFRRSQQIHGTNS